MIQKISQTIRRLPARVLAPTWRAHRLEVALDAAGQRIDLCRRNRQRRGWRIALDHEVVGQHDAVPGFDRMDLMVAIGVEGDEREFAAMAAEGDPLVVMLDFDGATRKGRGQDHDQRADHVVGLLGIAVRGEELTRPIHEHVVQFGGEAGAVGEPEVAPHTVEERFERLPPARLVDPDAALRDLPSIPHSRIEPRLSPQAVASRPRKRAQPSRHGACNRPRDAANALHFEAQVVGRAGPMCGEPAWCLDARESLAHVLQWGHQPVLHLR